MHKTKNILQQEEEFLKLNAEIDMKTKDLMDQVDDLREMQSNTEKLYLDWEKTDIDLSSETEENKNQKPCQDEINISEVLSIENYLLKEPKTKNETAGSMIFTSGEELVKGKEGEVVNVKRDKFRRNSKSSQSAKASYTQLSTANLVQESTLPLGLTRYKSDLKLKQRGIESDIFPESLKGVGQDGIMRFLTAKVKLLTEQIQIMQKDEKKHLEKIKDLQIQRDKSTEERDKLAQQANMAKNVLVKYEQQANTVVVQLQNTQAENARLKKELETLKREMRQSNQNYSANEIRLNRTLEEVEKLKSILQQVKQEEKEMKEVHRRKNEDLSNTIKKLDKQRIELLNGFKKQLVIIDNLKRQKGLIEAAKFLQTAEEDFINFLDCNLQGEASQMNGVKSAKSC